MAQHLTLVDDLRRRHRTVKQLRAQPYVGFTYYLGGVFSVLRKIERRYPDVDTSRAESALLRLRRDLRVAFKGHR
jgi:hypothetical protein